MFIIKFVFDLMLDVLEVFVIAFAAILVYTMYADQDGFLAIIDTTKYLIHDAVNFLATNIQTVFPG